MHLTDLNATHQIFYGFSMGNLREIYKINPMGTQPPSPSPI